MLEDQNWSTGERSQFTVGWYSNGWRIHGQKKGTEPCQEALAALRLRGVNRLTLLPQRPRQVWTHACMAAHMSPSIMACAGRDRD